MSLSETRSGPPSGTVTAPRSAHPPVPAASLLAQYGVLPGMAFDVVAFTSPCPGCGGPAHWVQHRRDTRLHSEVSCPAPGCRPPGGPGGG